MKTGKQRDWTRYAWALDKRLEGALLSDIAAELGVSVERARQMIELAKQQLAFRVFKGVPRPLPKPTPLTESAKKWWQEKKDERDIIWS